MYIEVWIVYPRDIIVQFYSHDIHTYNVVHIIHYTTYIAYYNTFLYRDHYGISAILRAISVHLTVYIPTYIMGKFLYAFLFVESNIGDDLYKL